MYLKMLEEEMRTSDQFTKENFGLQIGGFVLLSDHVDAKICLEVGAAVLLGKPMLVATLGGATVPDNLRRFASEIIELKDGTPGKFSIESQVAMKDALERMITKGV